MKRVLGSPAVEYLPATVLLAVTVAYLALAYGYAPDSRAVPVGVGWAMILLLALDLAARSRTRFGDAVARWLNATTTSRGGLRDDAPAPARRQIAAVLWLAGFTGALTVLGILAAVPLYVLASVRLRGRRSYPVALALAAGTGLAIWLLFAVVLRIDLYPGLLANGL